MRDERRLGHPMKDDILQMPRDAFPVSLGISDNDAESRENVGAEKRRAAASSTSEANDLPDGLMDVPQVAKYLRVSKTSVYKLIERQRIPHQDRETAACQERRARQDAPSHGKRHLIGHPMAARPIARDTHHIATTSELDAHLCLPYLNFFGEVNNSSEAMFQKVCLD